MFNYQGKSFFRGKCAKPRPIYYKTECLDCKLIISIKWERQYIGAFRTHRYKQKKPCPFCKGANIISAKIRYKDYLEIKRHWDIFDITETDI